MQVPAISLHPRHFQVRHLKSYPLLHLRSALPLVYHGQRNLSENSSTDNFPTTWMTPPSTSATCQSRPGVPETPSSSRPGTFPMTRPTLTTGTWKSSLCEPAGIRPATCGTRPRARTRRSPSATQLPGSSI
ncbi:MAG: hypothetical protein BYD32DRAFT_408306 [Podila humilis]|nr:MAG: hypothetical protein BYD32DRAFT_408306 [Podila humilis]